jgi:hypothetical protein
LIHRHRTTVVHYRKPLGLWDVYRDDLLGLVQDKKRRRSQIKGALLNALDSVLCPLDDADSCHRQEPAYLKKLGKGDASWATIKTFLGWILNTIEKTISLQSHRIICLKELLYYVTSSQERIFVLKWQQLLGELWSMAIAIAIPADIGLFSALHESLNHKTKRGHRFCLTRHTHAFLPGQPLGFSLIRTLSLVSGADVRHVQHEGSWYCTIVYAVC